MTLFNTKPLILFHLHHIFILWKPWLPISMSCRYCGLCSLKGRTINIILEGGEEMLPRDSKIEFFCQVSQNLSLVGINRSLTDCMLRKVLWVICNKLESGEHQEGLSIVPICFTLQKGQLPVSASTCGWIIHCKSSPIHWIWTDSYYQLH